MSGPILILVALLLSPFAYQLQGQLAPAPILLAPADGRQFEQSEAIEFLWKWDRDLGPGEKFRLTISGGDGVSADNLSYLTSEPKWTLDPSVALPGQYEWTVVAVYVSDDQKQMAHSQVSQAQHFQIHGSPAPELLEPAEDQAIDPGRPIVLRWRWYRELNAGEEFKVDFWRDDSSSTGITSTLTSETCYTLTLSPEAAIGTYGWTVGVVYAPSGSAETQHSETSSARHFRVELLPAPELLEPVDGQGFVRDPEIKLRWKWDRLLDPDERFQVTVENSDNPVIGPISQLITGTTYTLGLPQRPLPSTYKWSVAVVYAPDGQPAVTISQASKIGYFEDESMAAPTLLDPPSGQGFTREPEVALHWQWVRDLGLDEQYKVTLQNTDDPSSATFRFSRVPTLTLSLADRATGGQYGWQVMVVSVLGEQVEAIISQPSETSYFVDELPAAPILQGPANGQQLDRESAITLRWRWIRALAPGEQYEVKVWPDGQSPANSLATVLTDQTSWTLGLAQKTPDGRYDWTVSVVYAPSGRTEFVSSQTSETGYFTDRFPAAPRLIQPIDGRRFHREPNIVLDWQWKELKPGERFLVRVWCDDQPSTDAFSNLTLAFSWTLTQAQRAWACRYNWTVTVVFAPDGQPKADMSPTSAVGSFEDKLSSPPTLLSPPADQGWSPNRKMTLKWEWDRDLTEDERFQIIVWKPHDLTSESSSYLTRDRSFQIDDLAGSSGDEYNWRVGVVYAPSDVPQIQISQFSEIRRFVLVRHSAFWFALIGLVIGGAVWWFREQIGSRLTGLPRDSLPQGIAATPPTASPQPAQPLSPATWPSHRMPDIQPDTVLIVTVTKTEAQAVLEVFSQAAGKRWTRQTIGNKTYYNLGVHGGASVFMAQSEMGTATPGGALLTVRQAIQDLRPQAVIMCGIAMGLRPDKQQLGDILIAKQLLYYEPQKVDLQRGQMPRGDRTTSSERLLDRFRSGDNDWQGAKTHFGLILSGEKLVNDPAFRDWLLKTEQEAIGGEMEGAGLYAAARDAKVDWILVKAICDWADGKKNDDIQQLAAQNAARFVLYVLRLGGWGGPE